MFLKPGSIRYTCTLFHCARRVLGFLWGTNRRPKTVSERKTNTSGHKQIDPLNIGPLVGPLGREN